MWLDRKSPTAWVNSERVLFGSEHATALIASRPGRAVQRGSPVNLWAFAAVPKVRDSRFQATPTLIYGRLTARSQGRVGSVAGYLIESEGSDRRERWHRPLESGSLSAGRKGGHTSQADVLLPLVRHLV